MPENIETKSKPVNASTLREYGADIESLRDEWAMVEGYRAEIRDITRRMRSDLDKRGYVRGQLALAAEALDSTVNDEINPALWHLACAIHDQGGGI